jgi:hypothetical protein
MVSAMPEQGEIPPHSLLPEASRVVASTTPAPLAVLTVHEPVVATPLIQIEVSDGLATRVPRAALVGLTNAGSEET